MAETTRSTPSAKHAVGGEREKRQPYATESEAYEDEAVKSPKNSDLSGAGAEADARAQNIGNPHPDLEQVRGRK